MESSTQKPTRNPSAPSIYRPGLFNNKVAIVTGGGTGIGKSIAYELAFLGCTVVIASRNFERLKAAADKIQADVKAANAASVGSVHAMACNIRNEDEVSNLVDETLAKFERVDFLVNNAGGQYRSLLEDISPKGWQAVMNTNLNGTFLMIKKVYHAYMKEHGGSIVNIIIVLDKGNPCLAHSAAARAGVESLSKSLSVEWASSGITLNCVAPGIILSSGVENYPSGVEMFEYAAEKATAAKRMGSVEEVSASVLYYLSPVGAYVTGDTMHVDGGWHLMGPLLDVPEHENNRPYGTCKL